MLYINHSLLVFFSLDYSCYNSFVSCLNIYIYIFKLQSKILDSFFGFIFLYLDFCVKNIHETLRKIVIFHFVASPSSPSHSFILVFEKK